MGGGSFPPPHPLLLHMLGRKGKERTWQPRDTYINDDTFVKQALLLGGHDKIVGAVLIVNNVLKINPCEEKRACTQSDSRRASPQHRCHYLPAWIYVRQGFKTYKPRKDNTEG